MMDKRQKMTSARSVAYGVLHDTFRHEAYTNLSMQRAFRRTQLDTRDRGLVTELVYGTLQRLRGLDILLQSLVERPLEDLDVRVLTILRMTAYQLGYLDKVPAYAALNEAVEIAKRVLPKAAGFVNGVLRSFQRDITDVGKAIEALIESNSTIEKLAILYSFPTWLITIWEREFGIDRTERIMQALNLPAGLSIRVNLLRTTVDSVLEDIVETFGNIAGVSDVASLGIKFHQGINVESWIRYQTGDVSIQDTGAMLVAPLLQLLPGQRVLDLCAAPGSKTSHIAELMQDTGHVDAVDIHEHKLKLLRQGMQRLGITCVQGRCLDGRLLLEDPLMNQVYDAILVDAPCSGFGVLRHRPDIRYRRKSEDVESLAKLQRDLLRNAVYALKPGGVIVYATCTLLRAENEQVILDILDEHQQLVWDDIRGDLPVYLQTFVRPEQPGLLLTPELFGTDGFYMARLRKL